jgi:hypothetical protein
MIHPAGVEGRRAPLRAMNLIAFTQQKLGEERTVLARDPGDECNFTFQLPVSMLTGRCDATREIYFAGAKKPSTSIGPRDAAVCDVVPQPQAGDRVPACRGASLDRAGVGR